MSPVAQTNPWLRRFAWLLAALTLLLICSGGMVTSKGVGLAVPDWPTTFGYNMFLFPVSQWVGGILFEHTHRLIASTVGFLTIILAVWLWRSERRPWLRWLGIAALGAVILQGMLGGLRVTMLKDEIGIFHACLAQAFFGLLVLIALALSTAWRSSAASNVRSSASWVAIAATVLIYLQLGLGATMRHQHRDLAILDFPAAYGKVIPDVSPGTLSAINKWRDARAFSEVTADQIWLQMAHRFVALLITTAVVSYWWLVHRATATGAEVRTLSTWWLLLLAAQITLGAWTIWSNKAADVATTHVAVGATMLAFGVVISAITLRCRRVRDVIHVREMAPVVEGVHA
ncbi:MAG: COX15/CtaA family protein [Chthoniobacterales bacterium]|nr:COX15/CtaA family protein [Chthoniobacterales bacterium]